MVYDLKVVKNSSFQFPGTAMDTAPQLLFGEGGEKALDKVKPR